MYLEIMKPPTIIVTPKISDAIDPWEDPVAIGAFGLGAKVGVGAGSSSKGKTLFVFVLAFVRWKGVGSDFSGTMIGVL